MGRTLERSAVSSLIFWKLRQRLCLTLVLGGLLGVVSVFSASWAQDSLHMLDGQILLGKVKRITGEFVDFKAADGGRTIVRRMSLASRNDKLTLRSGRLVWGEVKALDTFDIDVMTAQGHEVIPRWQKKVVELGIPTPEED